MKTILYSIVIIFVAVACSGDMSEQIVGKWKVSDMKVDMKNVPQQLIDNARILSLATTYEFSSDGLCTRTISKNTLENGLKYKGECIFGSDGKHIQLKTDSLFVEKENNWVLIDKNDFNKGMFTSKTMMVENISSSSMTLSESLKSGNIIYTLLKEQ